MNKVAILFAVTLYIISIQACKKIAWHLPPKTMQKVLLDVNLAESYSTIVRDSTYKRGMKNIDSLQLYYKTIFNHYNITQEQFSESMEWYKNHPTQLDSVYNAMLNRVNKWQSVPAHVQPK